MQPPAQALPAFDTRPAGDPIARLDRIPVWPYPYSLLWVLGAAYFFAFFDIVNIGAVLPEIASEFHVTATLASSAITAGLIAYIIGAYGIGSLA
ncbi:sugar transport permease, partial [mine drainage metagenome]